MSIWKKAISVATSAALLASLLTAVAAPAVFAGTTVTSAGNVPRAGTSAGTATFVFTENSATALASTGSFTVTIADSAAGATVTFDGTPVVSAPGSLGVTVSASGAVLTVNITGFDNLNVETLTISGLKIKATAAAALGAITATLGGSAAVYNAFVGGTVTATGTLVTPVAAGATAGVTINVTSVCNFRVSGTGVAPNGNATFSDVADSRTVDAITGTATATGTQTIAFGAGTIAHPAGVTVTQTVDNCQPTALGSPGTVVDSAIYNAPDVGLVFAGENNQPVPPLSITERTAGYFSVGTTITFTIATTGVTFSNAPGFATDNGLGVSGGALSGDRKSVTYTVTTASGGPATLSVTGIRYDVASSVPMGTSISVGVALSGSKITVPTSRVNAVVNRIFTAVAGSAPNVFIGQNGQPTGLITLTEVEAGSFTDGLGSYNTFGVCVDPDDQTFTSPGPWAKVVSGDLKLREGLVVSPDNIVQGTAGHGLAGNCYYWTVWAASTTASVVQIGNADFTSGPLINVDPRTQPGPVVMALYVGSVEFHDLLEQVAVVNANRVYQGTVVVTALSQPVIMAGVTAAAGDIQIKETVAGSFKAGNYICLEIQPRASNNYIQDTWFDSRSQDLNPIPSATGGGMIVGAWEPAARGGACGNVADFRSSGGFRVIQQATGGVLGTITVKNIHYTTTADAPAGPVSLRVAGWGSGEQNSGQWFSTYVSNARIGVKSAIAIRADSALGVVPNQGPWSTSTKVAAANKFITWRFQGGAALAGKVVRIYVATRNANGGWGPFVDLTGRVADASGNAYFRWRATDTWVSVRAYFPGDASYAPSWSAARQGRWLS